MCKLTDYTIEQLVFIDESAANEHIFHWKYDWASIEVTSHEYKRLKRSKRWSILSAYTIDGFIIWEIEYESFSQELFEDFIENKLLSMCNSFLGVYSIIIMDNAFNSSIRDILISWNITNYQRLQELYDDAEVVLDFLSFYSPDFNSIEKTFMKLKVWMRKNN